jgi:DNA oxidative demethylase
MRATRLPSGGVMSVRTVCLGWHWIPYRYSRTVDDGGGSPVREFPAWLGELAKSAVRDAYGDPAAAEAYQPDIALINYYDDNAKMGLHQDRDERSLAPVVSLSLGAACLFRFGNTRTRTRPWTDVELRSGDLFVFGGPSRLAFHGVPNGLANPQPPDAIGAEIGLEVGRLNITIRESGLR